MKESFRQSMAWLHTWAGLVTGWVLFFVFVTGTAGYFTGAISRWMEPVPQTESVRDTGGFAVAQQWLSQRAPDAEMWGMDLPRTGTVMGVWWVEQDEEGYHNAYIDTLSGTETTTAPNRLTGGGYTLYRMHYALHYIPYDWAIRLVGICTMLMLLAIFTGVVTHKKIFRDFFTFRPRKGQRSWLDAHNLMSVTALPFFLMITWSGLVFFLYSYMPAGLEAAFDGDYERYHAVIHGEDEHDDEHTIRSGIAVPLLPLPEIVAAAEAMGSGGPYTGIRVDLPGDANAVANLFPGGHPFSGVTGLAIVETEHEEHHHDEPFAHEFEEMLLWLHEGRFAGPLLRWLYFGSGLLGCGMIATGLVLWTVKRRQKQLKAGRSDVGFRLVETLNIGTLAGLPVAIAAYFWANRLLPLDIPQRADWEVHCMFITWGLMLLWAGVRTPGKAWVEQLWLASAAFAFVPLLNVLSGGRHLGVSVSAGDWQRAGFELTLLVLGAFFAIAAVHVRRKWIASSPRNTAEVRV